MAKNIDDLIKEIDKEVHKLVKLSRYEHSVRVAETAQVLCERYDIDGQLGYLAGISHDICKDMDGKKLLALAKGDGEEITKLEHDIPSLLHGRAGAVYLNQKFGVTDPAVLEAVKYHTVGCPGMSDLALILYAADKIEPGRPNIEPGYLDKIEGMELTELVIGILQDSIRYLNEIGNEISPVTENFLYFLMKKQENGENHDDAGYGENNG